MSADECQQQTRYFFHRTYEIRSSERAAPVEEFSRADIDAFVKQILGVNQEKKKLGPSP